MPEQKREASFAATSPHALDLGVRAGKKVETVPDAITDEVLARLAPIFE